MQCRVEGSTAPGFESVRVLFEHNMRTWAERNAQLCVYHKGKQVVDLWASAIGDTQFTADSLVNIFSSGKSLEAIAIAALAGKGLLQYDEKVAHYWPEFSGGGKEDVTVADLMRHEAGLASFEASLDPEDLLPENIKRNKISNVIEQQKQVFLQRDVSKREYHAMTRGWIVNELFRRVDPAGRTVGEFLTEEIRGPLNADVFIGLDKPSLSRVSPVSLLGFKDHILASLKPRIFGRRVLHNVFQLLGRLVRILPILRKGSLASTTPPIRGMKEIDFFNEPEVAMGETPSANAHCSARGLARVAAMLSAGGSLDGTECLNRQAWEALHANPVKDKMGGLMPTRFTQGGVDKFEPCERGSPLFERAFNQGRQGFYGWMGLGGSIFQWHPEADIGFAFVPTSLHVLDLLNERGKCYQAEVLQCIGKLE